MSAEDSQFPAYRSRSAALLFLGERAMRIGGAVQAELKVSVSESVDRELASVDGFQQLMIFGLEKVQRADPPSLILTRPLKAAGEFAEPSAVVHRTESVPVAFVG